MSDEQDARAGLALWGWDDEWERRWAPYAERGLLPARVTGEERGGFLRIARDGEDGSVLARTPGRLKHRAEDRLALPATGDWVGYRIVPYEDRPMVEEVVARRTCFVRKAAGEGAAPQIIAANVDTVFVLTSANEDFNVRRLERYAAAIWESGATPVVLITKAELATDVAALETEARGALPGAAVHAVSVVRQLGLAVIDAYLVPGRTLALVGSSGVGKSTLANYLLQKEALATANIREKDGRGRHTTTARYLFPLPTGALLIDTPGMREFQLFETEGGLATTFPEVEELVLKCRFTDCRHQEDPGCAVRAAREAGTLREERWNSYLKLRGELELARLKADPVAMSAERGRWKKIHKDQREKLKTKRGR
jgi:ribosome biogenesis GTPase